MKENFGNLEELKRLGETKEHPYTIEQIINTKLKCTDGENMLEVKERMEKAINEILQNNLGQKVVIVSHGAAIKFYLSKWCEFRENKLLHNNTEITTESPSILKLTFNGENLANNEKINLNED